MSEPLVSAGRGPALRPISIEALGLQCGEVVGRSDWLVIDQAMVDRFADVTLDRQFIHVHPARASTTAFGGTIAHGFLLVSLLSALCAEVVPPIEDAQMAVNLGFDRVRFIAPVRTGSRIRASFVLTRCEAQKPGQWRTQFEVIIEAEGSAKPALIAEWLILWVCQSSNA